MSQDEIERAKYWETEYYKMREDWNTLLLHEVETAKQQSYAQGVRDGKKEVIKSLEDGMKCRIFQHGSDFEYAIPEKQMRELLDKLKEQQ